MAKIMLVEDDNNLREIYEARLLAEGYEIISAEDGEQALALAVKEKPDLIISDIMMPKISGFDMLDILRSTPETKHTKVIMMTALSQAEDKTRADKLGADRYLVKSQVTLEDVAKVAREVLQDQDTVPAAAAVPATPPVPVITPQTVAAPPAQTVVTPPAPPAQPPQTTPAEPPATPLAAPPAPQPFARGSTPPPATRSTLDPKLAATTAAEEAVIQNQINTFMSNLPVQSPPPSSNDSTTKAADDAAKLTGAVNDLLQKNPTAVSHHTATPVTSAKAPDSATARSNTQISGKKVISPINDLTEKTPTLNELLAKETAGEAAATTPATSVIAPGGGALATPPSEPPVETKPAGNVVSPSDPNSVAL